MADSFFIHSLVFLLTSIVLGRSLVQSHDSSTPDRKTDLLFGTSTLIHGRVVTCDNSSDADYRFPAQTWSCYNMSIDGKRLRSYYTPQLKVNSHCTDDIIGKNDLAGLCRELFAAHKIEGELWAALIIKNPSCVESEGERLMFVKVNETYGWSLFQAGKGHVHTLRCMLTE